jgi:hypothetical protein
MPEVAKARIFTSFGESAGFHNKPLQRLSIKKQHATGFVVRECTLPQGVSTNEAYTTPLAVK